MIEDVLLGPIAFSCFFSFSRVFPFLSFFFPSFFFDFLSVLIQYIVQPLMHGLKWPSQPLYTCDRGTAAAAAATKSAGISWNQLVALPCLGAWSKVILEC